MQAAYTEESMNRQTFSLLGTVRPNNESVHLISNNTSLLSATLANGGMDSCSFYAGPSDASILAFGESAESCGSIAYEGAESCGSIAYSAGSESCGSIASSSGSVSSGCACSYSC